MDFLARAQLSHGEFASQRYADAHLTTRGTFDSSPFVTTFVAYALCYVEDAAAADMRRKAVEFLLEERESPGVWRYWSSRNTASIDPDLDDTCCASFLLAHLAPGEHDNANRSTILANRTPRGLFKTWLRAPAAQNDVDSVVNANVILHLGQSDETRAACDALCRVVANGREAATTSYYVDPLALHYMMSRAHAHGALSMDAVRDMVIERAVARQRPDGSFGDALSTGLALDTLLNLEAAGEAATGMGIEHLMDTQRHDGSWPACAFYSGPEPPASRSVWWGAPELTTALCLEALAKADGRGFLGACRIRGMYGWARVGSMGSPTPGRAGR